MMGLCSYKGYGNTVKIKCFVPLQSVNHMLSVFQLFDFLTNFPFLVLRSGFRF